MLQETWMRYLSEILLRNFLSETYKISVFQAVAAGYTKSYHSEKLLKAVNNTHVTEIWRLLTCQNFQMICRPCYLDKQHANISLLIFMVDWLMAMHCSKKATFHFLSVIYGPTSILSDRNRFCGMFLNSHKYFQDIFLRRFRDVREETSFLRDVWDALKMPHEKKHLFWDVSETS